MQYTASSFAWSLIRSFRHLLWPYRHATRPVGYFPVLAQVESHTPDMAEHDFFAPIFRGISAAFQSFRTVSWPSGRARPSGIPTNVGTHADRPLPVMMNRVVQALRRGSVHIYLAFMVMALLAVFLFSSFRNPPSTASRPAVTDAYSRIEVPR
jgi:hypothetical protein